MHMLGWFVISSYTIFCVLRYHRLGLLYFIIYLFHDASLIVVGFNFIFSNAASFVLVALGNVMLSHVALSYLFAY
jgi:hypothetical protein